MSSTFNKNQISLANIDSKNIFKEIDYSTILSISKKPTKNTIYLEKLYQSVSDNLDKNSPAIFYLLVKIDKLKHKFKINESDELSDLKDIESMLNEQDRNQENNFRILQELHATHTNKQGYYTIHENSESILFNKSNLISRYNADLFSLLYDLRYSQKGHFASPDVISYQKNPIILNTIGVDLNQINEGLKNSYDLSQKYLYETVENMDIRSNHMQRTLELDVNITDLYITAKKNQNNIEHLLRELNSNSLMNFNSNNTVDELMKNTTELNTKYTKIKDLHNVFDQIKSSEYLDDIHDIFKQYNDTQINYQESDYQNNKEFKLLTELNQSISNLKKIKFNAKIKLYSHIEPINEIFTLNPKRETKHSKNINEKLEKLFNQIESRINIEIKKETGLYYDQSTYLINRSQLEKDILSVKENLANYIIENSTLAQEKKTHDSIEELTTQFHDELLRAKTLQKFVNLELNNHLHQFNPPSKIVSYTNNFGDKKNNIYMLVLEKKLLKNELNNLISNIHIKIPLKSTSSAIGEGAYYQTVKDKMYKLLDLTEQLGSLTKMYSSKEHSEILEYINDMHSLEKQIIQTEKEISQYIYTHSENKDKKSISSEITPLIIEIMNKKSKIMSIETRINEGADKVNFTDGNGNNKDFESLLSSIIAEFPQDTIISDVYDQPLHNKSMPVFIPLLD
ncbi:hypothetical protein AB7X09_15610 [Providencia rettgeri]